MKAITHKRLAKHLAEHFLKNCTKSRIAAFTFGCVQPDKNPATYIKGSLKQRLFHGHNWENAKGYIQKLCCDLESGKLHSVQHYYRLGKLIHYTSDAFTHTHNYLFIGDLSAHRAYEQLLDKQAPEFIHNYKNNDPYKGPLFHYISQLHRSYIRLHSSIATDIRFIILATEYIMNNVCATES